MRRGDLGGDGARRDMAGGAGRRAGAGGDRRRGSAGSVMKPSRPARHPGRPRPRLRDGQMSSSVRCGARRISAAPRRSAARTKSIRASARIWPKGRATDTAKRASVRGRMSRKAMLRACSVGTPLCPAGHLPHKGGDWQPHRRFANLATLETGEAGAKLPISPLVGEMSGRTEGGNVERRASKLAISSSCSDSKSRARPSCPAQRPRRGSPVLPSQAASSVRAAKRRRRSRIAGHRELPDDSRRRALRRQPDIGRDLVQSRSAAAIDHDRHLRPEPSPPARPPRCPRECARRAASGRRSRRGSSPASGACLDRHAGAHGDAQRVDIARQARPPIAPSAP